MKLIDNSNYKDNYNTVCNWPEGCFTQCGSNGIVGTKKGCYETAYFEAFPNDMFIRGEGTNIEEAEKKAYEKYIKYTTCSKHEFERIASYQNGMGKCKHCGYKKVVFEPDEDDIMFKSLNIKVSTYEELYKEFYNYHLKRFLEVENEKH